jgi:outer membrane receptor protein involved in Fe transport
MTGTAIVLVMMTSAKAYAQEQPKAPANAPSAENAKPDAVDPSTVEIVVSATRSGASGFAAATPTTVLSSASLQTVQTTNIADTLATMPAFKASTSAGAAFGRSQTPGINQANLRSLGTARTLVLVNGSRMVPVAASNNTQNAVAPDLNAIPELLIDRVEVVTGGASAQWGSDAVAGVINVLLKSHYEGIEIKGQAGISTYGDAGNERLGILAGTSFGDGHGHLVAAVDFSSNDRLGDIYTRPWGRQLYQIITNANFATNGLTALILAPNVTSAYAPGGLITGPTAFTLRGQQFVAGGGLAPYQFGTINTATNKLGGEGVSLAAGASLNAGVLRFNPYARAEWEFSPALTIFAEGSYSYTKGTLFGIVTRDNADTIRVDNAFLPTAVRTAMQAQSITSFTMNRADFDTFGNDFVTVTTKSPRVLAGAKGEFGTDWKWDVHGSWGKTSYENLIPRNRVTQLYNFAVDSVLSNGVAVCRATLAGASFNAAAAGCIPINLFGPGAASAAAIDYSSRTSISTTSYEQITAAANLQGKPFSTWAGPVAVGLGVEYRKEKQRTNADAFANAAQYAYNNATSFAGSFDVKEAYLDVVAPLAVDMPFIKSLNLNGAVRIADYSTVGSQTTWKVGLSYEPFDGLRIRSTLSQDIRAPALYELFSTGSVANNTVSVRGFQATVPTNSTLGNPNLLPERGKTKTIGLVLQPRFLPGFNASVDYYNIKLSGAIGTASLTAVQNFCNAGQAVYCAYFTFNPTTGAPTALTVPIVNLASVENEGVDFDLSYNIPLGERSSVNLGLSGNYTAHVNVDPGLGLPVVDRAGENSNLSFPFSLPHWRLNMQATYNVGPASLTAQVVYVGSGVIEKTYNTLPSLTINENNVPAVTYLNLFGRVRIGEGERMQLFGGIKNVFNRQPPPVPNASLQSATDGTYYDIIGRAFQVGFDVKF